ncbi:MAG TPA: hypothetical protein VKT31_02795 [Solirubrobacteraceae bacterium]|nr:hypothetical protein [Solirubrobacteraceae bacterium]
MAEDNIRDLQERLLADDDLREEFRQSPHSVLERHGISLTDDERDRLHAADLPSQSHDQITSKLQTDGLKMMW